MIGLYPPQVLYVGFSILRTVSYISPCFRFWDMDSLSEDQPIDLSFTQHTPLDLSIRPLPGHPLDWDYTLFESIMACWESQSLAHMGVVHGGVNVINLVYRDGSGVLIHFFSPQRHLS